MWTVLEGTLTERTERGTLALEPGTQRVFAPGHVHEVVNDALEPAVSLHVYYPGLTEMPMHSPQCSVPAGQDTDAGTAPVAAR